MKVRPNFAACEAAMELMNPFIDSMATAEETERLRSHLPDCEPCQRQLQAFISLRNLVAGMEPVAAPEDLALDIRVKLSRARAGNGRDLWQTRIDNVLRPFAVPAVMGVVLTFLAFGFLFQSLAPKRVLPASEAVGPLIANYRPPQTTNTTLKRFGAATSRELDQSVSIQIEVSGAGRAYDYAISTGTRSPGVDGWVQEMLLLARFRPATNWGNPVPSRVIFSVLNVRG